MARIKRVRPVEPLAGEDEYASSKRPKRSSARLRNQQSNVNTDQAEDKKATQDDRYSPTTKSKSGTTKKTKTTIEPASKPPKLTSKPASKPSRSDQESPHYWLMKAEPESRFENGVDVKFSIDDLKAATEPEPWDGVRNHVAKNNMLAMKEGDLAFFYHSNCKVPGIAGIMKIANEATVDESAFDSKHPYYDPKSSREKPRWYNVHVQFKEKFTNLISLKTLQGYAKEEGLLQEMQLLRQSRLSVSKVSEPEWNFIMDLVEAQKDN